MGLFGGNKEFQQQLKQNEELAKEQIDVQLAGVPFNNERQVGVDAQVSAMLLEDEQRILDYYYEDGRIYKCKAHQNLREPLQNISRSFIPDDADSNGLFMDFISNFGIQLTYGNKYGFSDNVERLFNNIVYAFEGMPLASRSHGQLAKLSKSQIAQTSAKIQRLQEPKRDKGLLGGFI